MRYLGIDYGTKRIGISMSDFTNTLASSFATLKNDEEFINNLAKIINENNITHIILGNPLNMNGSISDRCKDVIIFKDKLEKTLNVEIILQDERFSTISAQKSLIENNTKRKKRKNIIDSVASSIILQTYLDRKVNNEK